MTDQSLYAPDAERSVLGAILLDEKYLTALTVDEHLRPEHFADPGRAAIYRAAISLQDAGRPVDHLTITAWLADHGELETAGGADAVEQLTAWVPAAGNAREYGRLVRERHQARQLLNAGRQIQADVITRAASIDVLLERADQLLADINKDSRHGQRQHTWTPEQLRDEMLDDLGQGSGEMWRTPFPALDELLGGGMTRGEQMLIAGDEGLGKSNLIDAFLEQWAEEGLRAHLYVNEGGRKLRVRRYITRATGIPGRALKARDLSKEQMRQAVAALEELKVGITDCTGWTAQEIVRDIKRNRWDVWAVDIAHNIAKPEHGVEGWDVMAAELRTAPVQADGVMLLAVHTRKRQGAGVDPPSSDDIRDTKMFAALADQVLLLHRERDDGMLSNDGMLVLSKARDGETGKLKVTFQASRLRWRPALAAVSDRGVRGDQFVSPDSRIESSAAAEFVVEGGARF